jgi:uncharacterized protein YeaO (DUF488 family)
MAIRVIRLGSPREEGEGIRIGTVRRPPRGVLKEDFGKLNYYDVWLPQLSPSAELVSWIKKSPDSTSNWKQFKQRFMRELSTPDNQRLLDLMAAFSKRVNFSIGCYCEDENKCHRAILKKVLIERGAVIS